MTEAAAAAQPRRLPRASPRLAYAALVAAAGAAFAALLVWNAFQYDWLRGYDAEANSLYAQVLHEERRLPTQDDTTVWHSPPLFFALAGETQALAERLGWPADPHKAVQLLSVLAGVGLALLALATTRELWPESRFAQLAAFAFAASTPVLVRGSVLYHPEPLAALLTTAGVYVLVRAFARGRVGVGAGVAAGALLGLANLTRTWALAALAAAAVALALRWLRDRDRRVLLMAAGFTASALVLVTPWLAFKAVRHGSPLAFSQPNPQQWVLEGRPGAFYTSLALDDVFSQPYAPRYRNLLLPTVYSDWWGDYWRYYEVPFELVHEPERLPGEYHDPRVLQSFVGLLPSALILVGFVALAWRAVRERDSAALAVVSSVVLLVASFVYFLVQYPKLDGDNIKALYLLNAAVPLAVCGGYALAAARRAGKLVLAALLLLLLDLEYLNLRFLILPS